MKHIFVLKFLIVILFVALFLVYIQDIVDLCDISQSKQQAAMQPLHSTCSWRALILLVPVRLGAEKLNSIYGPCLTAVLTLENCIGIIGGRPKHSLYFVGFQGKMLLSFVTWCMLHPLYTANTNTVFNSCESCNQRLVWKKCNLSCQF